MNTTTTSTTATECPSCGQESGVTIPTSAYQRLLDQLAYTNPETLARSLRTNELVLVQCRANVGGLAATDERLLLVKNGQAHEFAYTDILDITIEKVGWFIDAVCQLITAKTPHQVMKTKAADASTTAVSLIRPWTPLYEMAKTRILEIRDTRKCRRCGAFVPISTGEWEAVGRTYLDPIPSGGAGILGAHLQPGERILSQVHGARFYKTIVVTDRRVMFVLGRSDQQFHAHSLDQIEGAHVTDSGIQLRFKGRPFRPRAGLVTADDGMPANDIDVPRLNQVRELIESLVAR